MSSAERPSPERTPGAIADRALEGDGILEVGVLPAKGAWPDRSEVFVYRPHTIDGREPPSPSLVLPVPPELGPERKWRTADRRTFEWDGGTCRAQVAFPPGTSFYGTGEVCGPLRRNGLGVTLWNADAWGFSDRTPALYQSHPWVLALLPDGRAVGLLADSARRGRIECLDDGVEFAFEDEPFDLIRIEASTAEACLGALAEMLGPWSPPPRWALGYHQCRWSYETADEVLSVARELRAREIPCSAIWLDIDYMDRFRVFTWDAKRFPDPHGLIDELHGLDLRVVAIVDPGVAAAKGYDVYEEGLSGGHFVTDREGRPLRGRVWAGTSVFPDFTSPTTRAWWADRVRRFVTDSGLDGLWCDMNEPSLFRTPTRTLPTWAQHEGDEQTGPGDHARFHNLYGQLMARATREGLEAVRSSGSPPFVLTRASHLAGSRFAATWTGDNLATWEDLRWCIPMVLNLGLSGQPFAGPDAGGFAGDPDAELFVRFFELCSLMPFFRGHAEKHSCRKEPWSFGDEAEAHVRAAIERRVRLEPTIAALLDEAAHTGVPACRPVWFAGPTDPALRDVDDAFLLGPDHLVAPVVEPGATTRTVYLPRSSGGWRLLEGRQELAPGEVTVDAPLGTLPVFVRR